MDWNPLCSVEAAKVSRNKSITRELHSPTRGQISREGYMALDRACAGLVAIGRRLAIG